MSPELVKLLADVRAVLASAEFVSLHPIGNRVVLKADPVEVRVLHERLDAAILRSATRVEVGRAELDQLARWYDGCGSAIEPVAALLGSAL